MKKTNIILSMIAASFLWAAAPSDSNIVDINTTMVGVHNETELFAEHEAIILFKENTMAATMIEKMQKLFGADMYHKEYSIVNGMHIFVPNKSFEEIQSMIGMDPLLRESVERIEKNYANIAFKSNDTYYSKLWAIENSGQSVNNKSGTKDADMDVDEAWQIEKGEHDVVVAVLDTGVDYTHSDLADNMWSGNAKHGYDFAGDNDGHNDDDPMPDTPYNEKGHYHGTHVAGTIGAVGDNSNGVSGVAQNVQIMAVKVFRPNGYGYSSDILEGLDFVGKQKDKGVNIVAINASYGGDGGQPGDSMDQAIQKLGDKGIVFCAAAGNSGKDIDSEPVYPAAYTATNIITVAASDQDDKLASFSNYGKKTVEVAAPGTNILSTYPENKYAYLQGTSMATPQVAGIVALLASVNPSSNVDDRIAAIEESVDTKSNLSSKVSTGGRVNSYKAVKALSGDSDKNRPPVANDDSATTDYEKSVVIDVLKNDSDADGDTLTIKSLGKPSHGTAEVESGKVKYTPAKGYSGKDSFKYTVSDGKGGEAEAVVTITVNKSSEEEKNHPPVAKGDFVKTDFETKVLIDVLKNDSDVDGDSIVLDSISQPKNGKAVMKANKIEYTPKSGFSGKDSLRYTIRDAKEAKATGVIEIEVAKRANTPPVAKDDTITVEYGQKALIDIVQNDSDADGDALEIESVTKPSHGMATVENGKVLYTPESGFSGEDSFEYIVSDGKGGEAKAKVAIVVKEMLNRAPEAKSDSVVTEFEQKITIDVLKNDSDLDGDALVVKSTTEPMHGKVEIIEENRIEYQPQKGYSGSDVFEYTISDSRGGEAKAKVTVMVKAKEDDGSKKEFHFPIIGDGDVESVVKLFTNFTKVVKDDFTEFKLEQSQGDIKVYNSGEMELKNLNAPLPEGKLPPGSKLEVKKDKLSVEFKLTKKLWFK